MTILSRWNELVMYRQINKIRKPIHRMLIDIIHWIPNAFIDQLNNSIYQFYSEANKQFQKAAWSFSFKNDDSYK